MAVFNNKETDETGMPPEVHQYYQAEHRERVGVAWLLAFATLVITVGVALGGYFGGRSVYRKVVKKDKDNTSQVASGNKTTNPAQSSSSQSPNNSASNSSNNTGNVSDQPASTPKPPTTTQTPKPSTPAPAPSNNQLPHTGPDGDD